MKFYIQVLASLVLLQFRAFADETSDGKNGKSENGETKGPQLGTTIAVFVAGLAFCLIVCTAFCCFVKRRRKKEEQRIKMKSDQDASWPKVEKQRRRTLSDGSIPKSIKNASTKSKNKVGLERSETPKSGKKKAKLSSEVYEIEPSALGSSDETSASKRGARVPKILAGYDDVELKNQGKINRRGNLLSKDGKVIPLSPSAHILSSERPDELGEPGHIRIGDVQETPLSGIDTSGWGSDSSVSQATSPGVTPGILGARSPPKEAVTIMVEGPGDRRMVVERTPSGRESILLERRIGDTPGSTSTPSKLPRVTQVPGRMLSKFLSPGVQAESPKEASVRSTGSGTRIPRPSPRAAESVEPSQPSSPYTSGFQSSRSPNESSMLSSGSGSAPPDNVSAFDETASPETTPDSKRTVAVPVRKSPVGPAMPIQPDLHQVSSSYDPGLDGAVNPMVYNLVAQNRPNTIRYLRYETDEEDAPLKRSQ